MREGFRLYCPKVRVPTSVQQFRHVPLFPGYVFLRCDIRAQALPMVSRFPGVLGWVKFGGQIPKIPDEEMSALQGRVEEMHSEGGLWQKFHAGQQVKVSHGKLDALAIVLDEPSSPDARVKVLLEFMGRQVHATVPWRQLNPVPQTSDESRKGERRTRGRGRVIRRYGLGATNQA